VHNLAPNPEDLTTARSVKTKKSDLKVDYLFRSLLVFEIDDEHWVETSPPLVRPLSIHEPFKFFLGEPLKSGRDSYPDEGTVDEHVEFSSAEEYLRSEVS
jgi:hypothetical protein